jgi:signal transduction histidine kinase/CheY-like chemotaxis protein
MSYHRLLERQIRNASHTEDGKLDLKMLYGLISDAYETYEKSQAMRDKAFDLIAAELTEHRERLEKEVAERTAELRQAMEHAESANRLKSDFLATMSHEIRTPLNGVIGTADILSRTALNSQQEDYVRTVRKSAESLLYVLNDILDLTKLEARQLGLEMIPFDFSRTVEDVVGIHSGTASKKELDLLLRYAPGTPERIVGDPGRLRQVISNLLGNAVKFTEEGHVLVNVEVQPHSLKDGHAVLYVSVQDTGIGIPHDKLELVFERFRQAEASTTRKFGGSGLGLSICKQLVELMGGEIGVESEYGKGSKFWFTLPAQVDGVMPPAIPLADSLAGARVMVVDDNLTNLIILREELDYWQCKPVCFDSGEKVLDFLQTYQGERRPFDVAIVDHNMPDMDGAVLGEHLKDHPLTQGMPMMIFSSYGMLSDKSFFEERGFTGYLVKPARPEDLHLMLQAMMKAEPGTGVITRYQIEENQPRDPSQQPDTNKVTSPFRGMRILVVEDDPVNQRVVRMLLEEVGCDVAVASSGKVAVEACRGESFDLIFMDMQMPEMDGQEAARIIRQEEAEGNKPHQAIVALTANAMKEHEDLCLQAGMDAYMTKPVTLKKLTDQLNLWFYKARPQEHVEKVALENVLHLGGHGAHSGHAVELSLDHLKSLLGDDPVIIQQLLEIFETSAKECLGHLEVASATQNRDHWRTYSHRLKGASANMGFSHLEEVCAHAEQEAPTGDLSAILRTVELEIKSTLQAIPALVASLKPAGVSAEEPGA